MLNYKKPAFWVIVAVAAACIVAAVYLLAKPDGEAAAAEPFGRNYSVETIVYAAPQYSFSYTPETAPDYRLTARRELLILEDKSSDNWLNAGTLAEEALSPSAFDDYFKDDGVSGWRDEGINAEKLRLDTQKAWRLDVTGGEPGNVFYLLLQQKNGDVYLTYGYDDGESGPAAEPGSLIRWAFKLGTAPSTGVAGTEAAGTASDIPADAAEQLSKPAKES